MRNLLERGYNILEKGVLEASRMNASLPEVLYKVAREFFDYAASHEKFYLFMLALFYSGRENEAYKTVSPFIENYYNIIVGIFENRSIPAWEHARETEAFRSRIHGSPEPPYYDSKLWPFGE